MVFCIGYADRPEMASDYFGLGFPFSFASLVIVCV